MTDHHPSDELHGDRPIAVVTGASAGVGRATAVAMARHGFDVAVLARGEAGLHAAAEDVRHEGGQAMVLKADVSVFDEVESAAERVEAEWGPIDVWVNDAMTTIFQRVIDTDPADFARAVDVTFLGQVHGTMAALRRMVPRDRGNIVNVGSALAYLGIPLQAPYCASKFACRGFFQSVRAELLADGSNVRISMVHLPAVNTPQFDWCQTDLDRHPQPVPPIYHPEVAAEAIVRTALDGRQSKVVGTWNTAIVAVGSVAPGLANHFAAISGITSQLTDWPISPDRTANLRSPVDQGTDFGSHGAFDDRAGGVLDPNFLSNLPTTASQFARSLRALAKDKVRTLRVAAHQRSRGWRAERVERRRASRAAA